VHHYGKSAETGLRGASAFRAGADFVIAVHCKRDTLGNTSDRHIALEKSRDGEEGPLSGFDLTCYPLGTDSDGDPFGSCVITPHNRAPQSSRRASKQDAAFIEAFREVCGDNGKTTVKSVKEAFAKHYQANGKDPASAIRTAFSRILRDLPPGYELTDNGLKLRHMVGNAYASKAEHL
jgi:hypothetical protein